jgi:putative ABC transport system permease protein
MLTSTLLKTGLRDLLRRPLQTGLMILGVALGVAVVIAIDLANTSAGRAFTLSTEAVVGKATHQILGGPDGLPADLYRQVRVEWGFRQSAPVVEGVSLAPDLDAQPLRILGLDPIADAPFRSYLSNSGSSTPISFARFYTEPNTALIGAGLAGRYGLKPDDTIRLQVNDRLETVTIVGILTPGDESNRRALDGLLIMDVAAAQELLGLAKPPEGLEPSGGSVGGRLTRIDLILADADVERLKPLLPTGARLAPATEQADTVAQLTSAFQLNLTALSLLALIVGMFLIYNTMMFSVVQRRAVFGVMRSLGVTGGQLFALILAEAAIASTLGAALGLGLGWLLGQGAVRLVTQTINDLYYALSVRDAPLTLFTTIKGLGLGIGAGVLAAAAPAAEAAGVEPVTAMRSSTLEDRVRKWLPIVGLVGVVIAGAGTAALLGGGDCYSSQSSLVFSFGGLFAIVIGLALVVPMATIQLMGLATTLLSPVFGTLGRLAARTVVKAISRTSVAIAALMVAVSVTIGVSVMIASFRATVTNWLDLTLRADVYISAPSVGRNGATLSPDLAKRVAAVPGVAEVETFRAVTVDGEFGQINLAVADSRGRRSAGLYRFADGSPDEIWAKVLNGAVIVSEPFAYRHNIPPHGGTVTLKTDRGDHTFPVVGIFYDYASDRGTVLMSENVYHEWWNDRGLTSVAAFVADGHDPNEVADNLRAALSGTTLQVQVNRALRDQALVIFDRTFAITNALRILAVLVAFIGVLSALMALQIERTRELSTMQAVGLTQPQLWRLTLLETGLMGATAGVLSLPVGFVLSLVLIYVINLRSFGWTIQMTLDPWVFAQAVAVSVAAALLAAVYPLIRLQKMPVAVGLRQE